MPTTITLNQLVKARPALERILKMTLPMAASYRLSRRFRIIMTELEAYEKRRNDLVTQLGRPVEGQPDKTGIAPTYLDAESKKVVVDPNWAKFVAAHNELLDVQVSLEIDRIPVDDLKPLSYDAKCPKCGERVGEVPERGPTVEDLFLLDPLLAQ